MPFGLPPGGRTCPAARRDGVWGVGGVRDLGRALTYTHHVYAERIVSRIPTSESPDHRGRHAAHPSSIKTAPTPGRLLAAPEKREPVAIRAELTHFQEGGGRARRARTLRTTTEPGSGGPSGPSQWNAYSIKEYAGRMSTHLQGSLFDQTDELRLAPLNAARRTALGAGAWIDLLPGWLSGADALFERLVSEVPWRAERRQMYEHMVDVPRLLSYYGAGDPLPHPVLDEARDALSAHYAEELGEPFTTAGLCYYRDGRDSVAWHGDRIGRGAREDTMVAILSVGAPRDLLLRPRRGGESVRRPLGHGDLIVMGGSCQRTWEHAVPKTARAAGPRISVQFRPQGVN